MDAAYVSGMPGSRITLNTENIRPPWFPNDAWYTFHGPWAYGLFMNTLNGVPWAEPDGVISTSDSYAIAISVPG